MIHIDVETRSRVNLKAAGAWKYAEDPSTEVILMCWSEDGKRVETWINPKFMEHYSDSVPGRVWSTPWHSSRTQEGLFAAWNAEFEIAIWEKIMVPRHGFPPIRLEQWRDTMAQAAAAALPLGLGDCAKVIKAEQQKSKDGHNVMMQMCKPRTPTKNNPSEWFMDPERLGKLAAYCQDDVRTEAGLHHHLPDLLPQEDQVWLEHIRCNRHGIYCDLEYVHAINKHIEAEQKAVKKLCTNRAGYPGSNLTRVEFTRQFLASVGLETPDLAKLTLRELLKRDDLTEQQRIVLDCRRQIALTSTKKLTSMVNQACEDQRIRGTLAFHGAFTGRWAGRGIQPQNLPRGTKVNVEELYDHIMNLEPGSLGLLYDKPLDDMTTCVRQVLCAPPGKDLLCADYSAIEARLVFWLARDPNGLAMYNNFDAGHGDEPYRIAAAEDLYHIPISEVTSRQRAVGKQQILGCGYGMGAKRFAQQCFEYDIDLEGMDPKFVIDRYRNKYDCVPAAWARYEAAAIKALQTKKPVVCDHVTYFPARLRNPDRVVLYCVLPSGRRIAYAYPKLKTKVTPWGKEVPVITFWGIDSYTRKWCEQTTWGGTLFQGATQGIARDFIAEAFLRCRNDGRFTPILTVHDEILAEIDSTEPNSILADFCDLLCELPEWAKIDPLPPIQAAGWRGKRYRKD